MIEGVDNTASTPDWMARKLLRASQQLHSLEVIEVNNADHFETVDAITDENGELFNKTLRLFES